MVAFEQLSKAEQAQVIDLAIYRSYKRLEAVAEQRAQWGVLIDGYFGREQVIVQEQEAA